MDGDTLRERIAKVHFAEGARRAAEQIGLETPVTWDDLSEADREVCRAGAQAVIDDLGLKVETMALGGEKDDGTPFTSARIVGQLEEVREQPHAPAAPRTRRLKACVDEWPDCGEGEYHPLCCRFPKSCSCTVYDPERVSPEDLEDLP